MFFIWKRKTKSGGVFFYIEGRRRGMQAKYFVSEIKYTKKNAKEIGPTKEKVD